MALLNVPTPRFKPGSGVQQPQVQQVLREAPTPAVVQAGPTLTPEQVARKRAIAEQLAQSGMDYSPVQHWTQGLARVANALAGNLEESRADKAEKEGSDVAKKAFDDALAEKDPQARMTKLLAVADNPWASKAAQSYLSAEMAKTSPEPTDDMREYDWAVQHGFKGSPMDYLTTLRRSGVTPLPAAIQGSGFSVDAQGNIIMGGGNNAPPTQPDAAPQPQPDAPANSGAGIVPLTGDALKRANLGSAPTGKQWGVNLQTGKPALMDVDGFEKEVPGEIAARFGLSTDFFRDVDFLTKQIEKGVTTGLEGQTNLALGRGAAGQVWRLASDGSDAMQRLLTGAGMPASEAENYVARFLPTFGDTKATQLDKVRNLTRRLKGIVETAARGRLPPEEVKRILGVTEVGDKGPQDAAPDSPEQQSDIPQAAIDELMKDPSAAAEFDKTFGDGAAARFLKGGQGGPEQFAPLPPENPDPYGIKALSDQRKATVARHQRMLSKP